MNSENKFSQAEADRRKYVDAILNSGAQKIIIVAGPGTGKTFLFKELLKDKKKKALTLTFVNSLVEDLALELRGMSEVKTLHGLARGILAAATGSVQVFPLLSRVIRDEFKIHNGADVDFDAIFNARDDASPHIPFYKSRKDFYRHNGHTDLVFAAARYLETYPKRTPKYDWVLVDEFQDFNKLEVSLINSLAKKNKILIAGDDDQALYFFKDASPLHIRQRYQRQIDDYVPFTLIHCSRCTRVIVDAFNDIIKEARAEGFLKERVDKDFLYFEDAEREADCEKYPKLTHLLAHNSQIAYAIERELDRIALDLTERFSVLVIAPTKNQCRSVVKSLRHKGFRNVSFVDREEKTEPDLLDGVMLLLSDKSSNLGWRILAKAHLSDIEFQLILEKSISDPSKGFHELVDPEYKKRVKKILASARKIIKGRVIEEDDCKEILSEFDLDPVEVARRSLRTKLEDYPIAAGIAGLRDLPIKVTTIPGAKGLSEDFVFIAHFDDRFYLNKEGKVTDQNICNLLVALTRARKRICLISCQPGDPKFLSWISNSRIETVNLRGE